MLELDILFVIVFTSIIQSLFGVGVLLFGTPMMLLLNYDFIESLLILLPVSATINLMQVLKDSEYINKKIYKSILIYTIPFIVITLFLIEKSSINLNIIIGLFLILLAIKENISWIKNFMNSFLSYNRLYYITMGIIHGLTNLGGSLLSAKIFYEKDSKNEKRVTIAISYLTFALFQIGTIFLTSSYENFSYYYIYYAIIGFFIYFIVNKLLYKRLNEIKYHNLFKILLLVSGILLILK